MPPLGTIHWFLKYLWTIHIALALLKMDIKKKTYSKTHYLLQAAIERND